MTLVERTEVVEQLPTLDQLAGVANREHGRVVEAGVSMVEHAIRAGDALVAAKIRCTEGAWTDWLREHFVASHGTAQGYIRVAEHQDLIRASLQQPSLSEALRYLRGLPRVDQDDLIRTPPHVRENVVRLHRGGTPKSEIGALLGLDRTTVRGILDPSLHERRRRQQQQQRAKRRAARLALRQKERDDAVRRVGGSVAESYSMIRRTAQVVDRAQRDAGDREVRAALKAALAKIHGAEDEIVRALGIS